MRTNIKNIFFALIASIWCSLLFIPPTIIYAQTPVIGPRAIAIEQELARLEIGGLKQNRPIKKPTVNKEFLKSDPDKKIPTPKKETKIIPVSNIEEYKYHFLEDAYASATPKIGYIKGHTMYDFDHNISELEYPLDNAMAGGSISLGKGNLSLTGEFWTPIVEHSSSDMKDKDWNSQGTIISHTESESYLQGFIADGNIRYDFLNKVVSDKKGFLLLNESDKLKLSLLAGYRYQKFDFDMYNIYYPDYGVTYYDGVKTLTYKIKYKLPYVGLAADIESKNYGLNMAFKYSFHPRADDVDNHLLRGLTFYGKYNKDKLAVFGNIDGYLKLNKYLKFKAGADGTYIRIDGTTWEDQHDPDWDKDQYTKDVHWIFWMGLEYLFG